MKRFLVLLPMLYLAACASGPSQYVLQMQSYQGASEAKVIDDLGPPDRTYDVGGTRYISYTKISQNVYRGNPSVGGYYGHGGIWGGTSFSNGDSILTQRCDAFFAIKNRRVAKVGFRGNNC